MNKRPNRLITIVLVTLLAVHAAKAFTFTSDDGSFSVVFPAKPKLEVNPGEIPQGGSYRQYIWSVEQGDHYWGVAKVVYSQPPINKDYDSKIRNAVSALNGKLRSLKPFEAGGLSGSELIVDMSSYVMRQRLMWVGDDFYQMQFLGLENDADIAVAFFNSFHVLK